MPKHLVAFFGLDRSLLVSFFGFDCGLLVAVFVFNCSLVEFNLNLTVCLDF
jgi:hypothetical protein